MSAVLCESHLNSANADFTLRYKSLYLTWLGYSQLKQANCHSQALFFNYCQGWKKDSLRFKLGQAFGSYRDSVSQQMSLKERKQMARNEI